MDHLKRPTMSEVRASQATYWHRECVRLGHAYDQAVRTFGVNSYAAKELKREELAAADRYDDFRDYDPELQWPRSE